MACSHTVESKPNNIRWLHMFITTLAVTSALFVPYDGQNAIPCRAENGEAKSKSERWVLSTRQRLDWSSVRGSDLGVFRQSAIAWRRLLLIWHSVFCNLQYASQTLEDLAVLSFSLPQSQKKRFYSSGTGTGGGLYHGISQSSKHTRRPLHCISPNPTLPRQYS